MIEFSQLKKGMRIYEARTRIVELLGDVPRIELFAREKHQGWDAWGNEVPTEEQQTIKEVH